MPVGGLLERVSHAQHLVLVKRPGGTPVPECFRVEEEELARFQEGQVRVEVAHCGLCHSDLSIVDGTFPSPVPIVLGHEAAGIVDAVGPGVASLSPGDPVVLTPCPPCGACYWCVRGDASLCVQSRGIQTSALPDGRTGLSRGGEPVYRGVNVAAFAEYEREVISERIRAGVQRAKAAGKR